MHILAKSSDNLASVGDISTNKVEKPPFFFPKQNLCMCVVKGKQS